MLIRFRRIFCCVSLAVLLFWPVPASAIPPGLTSIGPATGIQGQSLNMILQGSNFTQGTTTVAVSGSGVGVSGVQVVTSTALVATFTVDVTAAPGSRNVTVTTADGTSGAVTFSVVAGTPPTLSAIDVPNGSQGQTLNITLTGTNFVTGATFVRVSQTGVGVSNVNVTNPTSLTATLTIASAASTGSHTIDVTTAGGTSGTVPFSVLGVPLLFSGNGSAPPGTTTNVTLSGNNFAYNATSFLAFGSGVTINSVTNSTSTNSRVVSVSVASDATPGTRSFTVITPAGSSSGSAAFFVLPPPTGYLISTVAGKTGITDGGSATTQSLPHVRDVARDSLGNLYIAAPDAQKIYKVTPGGTISAFAGTGLAGSAGDGGPATAAQLALPMSVAVDASDNVYIAEGNQIRKVSTNGTISTFAGRGAGGTLSSGFGGDGGPAYYALFSSPSGLTFDSSGNLYVIDRGNSRIRKITTGGVISTVAGDGTTGFGGDGGPATSAQLNLDVETVKLAVDGSGNIYIPDSHNNRIRRVASNGTISTFAGTGSADFSGDAGQALIAALQYPTALLFDGSGNLFVSDYGNSRIRRIASDGTIVTVAGNGGILYDGDGPATSHQVSNPLGLALGAAGGVYFIDETTNRVRLLSAGGTLSTVVSDSGLFSGDTGQATAAQLNKPTGVAVDSLDNVLISDAANGRIRKVATDGSITTIAGNGSFTVSGNNGQATAAGLGVPFDVATGPGGAVYIAATNTLFGGSDSLIWKVAQNGTISIVAGGATSGFAGDNGPATSAQLNAPEGVAVDASGNIYVGDTENHRVRKVSAADNSIVTVAGTGAPGFSGDNGPATSAQLTSPTKLAVDSTGNLYITDAGNSRIRKVDGSGTITTLVQQGRAVAVRNGNVFAAGSTSIVQSFDTGGAVALAGNAFNGFSGDNGPAVQLASVNPEALAVMASGALVFADPENNVVRKLTPVAEGQAALTMPGIYSRGGGTFLRTVSLNGRNPAFTWSATTSVTTPSGGSWLGIAPSSGVGGDTMTVTLNPAGLSAGVYNGSVTLTSPSSANGTLTVPITLEVVAGSISASPASIQMTGVAGGFPSQVATNVRNGGTGGDLPVTVAAVTASGSWLSASTANLTADSGTGAALTVVANPVGMATGVYTGAIVLTSAGVVNSPVSVPVRLTLNSPGFPSLISVTPTSGSINQTVTLTLNGANFVNGATVNVSGTGVTVSGITPTSSTSLRATLTIASDASASTRTLTVTTPGGTSSSVPFTVLGPPTLTSAAPSIAARSRSLSVTLTGTNFAQTATMVAVTGTGVTVSNIISSTSTTSRTLTLTVAPDAPTGNRQLTVMTPGGTSNPVTFTVTPATGYTISTLVGHSAITEGGTATAVVMPQPNDTAIDTQGNLYIVSTQANKVYKVTAGGVISTFAGTGTAGNSGDGGPAVNALLNSPVAVMIDSGGNVLISDRSNNRIRKVTPDGTIRTMAGTGTFGSSGDNGPALYANLANPSGLGMDSSGALYIMEASGNRIRKILANGTITTIAGSGTPGYSGDGGPALLAQLSFENTASKLAIDGAGNLYIPDTFNNRIRMVSPGSLISTVAGTGVFGNSGDGGPATSAKLGSPKAVAIDGNGNLLISDTNNNRLRKITNGMISTLGGTSNVIFNGDGPDVTTRNISPVGLTLDTSGNIYVADQSANRLRKITPAGAISTLAGHGGSSSGDSGPAALADVYFPTSTAVDSVGNLLIADSRGYRIRKVDSNGTITTIAGTGAPGASPDLAPAVSTPIDSVQDLTVDASGNIYFSTFAQVRKITTDGLLHTVAGTGSFGFSGDGGSALSATFSGINGIAVDNAGNVFVSDSSNQRVRKVSASDGTVNTIAGTGSFGLSGDSGPATAAQLNFPQKVVVDTLGNVYIADSGNSRIRRIAPDQTITTFSTLGGRAVALDSGGNIFISSGSQILEIFADGTSATLAGVGFGISGDNGAALMASINASSVSLSSGAIYFTDSSNNAVRKLTPVAPGSAVLSVSPVSLNTRLGNVSGPSSFTETIALNGTGSFTWTAVASVNTPTGTQWLQVNPLSGEGTSSASATVYAAGLEPGSYNGQITITSPQAVNGPIVLPVTLNVLPQILTPNPATLSASTTVGGASPSSQAVSVGNSSTGPSLFFTAAAAVTSPPGGNWLSVSPNAAVTTGNLTVSFNSAGLGAGIYAGSVTLSSNQAANSPVTVPVTLTVAPVVAPVLTTLTPAQAGPNQSVTVTLTGTNFAPAGNTVNVSGSGVTVGTVTFVSGTSLVTNFTISSGAALGARDVTVTTAAGTSNAALFTLSTRRSRSQITSQ